MAEFILLLFLVSATILEETFAATVNGNGNYNPHHQLRKRFNPPDFLGHGPDTQWHSPNRRSGFDNDGPSEFYPDYGYPNSNSGYNDNRGSGSGSNKQNSGGFNSQNNAGSYNNQGSQNSRPNQGGRQNNSNKKPQNNTQGSKGSGQQSSAGSSSQSSSGSMSNQGGQSGTTQRAPLNIILNENTMDNSTVRECIQKKCPSTNEYNPICGDDNITYQNPSKFKCAQFCKSGVKQSYRGSCVTTPSPN